MTIRLDDLLRMDGRALRAIVDRAEPFDPAALDGLQYQGVDLSLPRWVNRILWKTFRKTFLRDPATGRLRGWNVRMEQRGIDGPRAPMRGADGQPRTFAHYELREAQGRRFPGGWAGAHYLHYGVQGNPFPESAGRTPLVAVNAGSADLLLGWEVVRVGPLTLDLRDFWALRVEGPIDHVPAPRR